MRFLLIIILISFAFGCDSTLSESSTAYSPNPDMILATEIRKKIARQLKKEDGLQIVECGWSGSPQIWDLHCGFFCDHELNVNEARELIFKINNLFLLEINTDKRIYPHLAHFPFVAKDIEIRIFVQKPDGSGFGSQKLSVVSMTEGVLRYKIDEPNGKRLITVAIETYEEAEEKRNAG